MGLLNSVFRKLTPDKRRARRVDSPPLVAFYWDGNTPTAHPIQNVSLNGFYLLTSERMRPGTVITMTLQRAARNGEDSGSLPHMTVMSRVVWQGEDGVGFAFIPQEPKDHGRERELGGSKPAGTRAISKFLEQINSDGGNMMIQSGAGIPKQPPSRPIADPPKPKAKLMRRFADESGQTLITSALAMTCLLGFVALATDVGIMMRQKRIAQTAADAAAIAGALELKFLGSSATTAIQTAGTTAAGLNGFTNGSNGVTVTINVPPQLGPHAGASGYVEAIVSIQQPTIFMGIFGFANMTPTARAVATDGGGASYGCLYALSPTGTGMTLQGDFNLSAPNCGIVVDSNDPTAALSFTGKAGHVTAGSLGVVGGVSGTSKGPTNPVSPIVAQSDPLSYLIPSFPTPTGCTAPPGGTLTGTITPSGTVCYSGPVTISNATLNSGVYVFTGDVTLGGTVNGNGATLDLLSNTATALTENAGTTLNIVAPTSGTWNGIAIMAPTSNTGTFTLDKGEATGSITGIIYAPDATLSLQDNGAKNKGGLTLTTDLIIGTLNSGPSPFTITSYTQTVPGSPLTRIALVE